MKKIGRKKLIVGSAITVALIAGIILFMNIEIKDVNDGIGYNEIIPQEEISDEQLRETIINLYFVDSDGEIVEESRKVDSKILIKEPYRETMNLLLSGPKSEKIKSCIPSGVRICAVHKDGECLKVDLSKEFVENIEDNQETQSLAIRQIVNTMTQFNEINCIKILIEGEENLAFKSGNIRFEQLFFNED